MCLRHYTHPCRQIRRLLGLGSWTEEHVVTLESPSSPLSATSQAAKDGRQHECEPTQSPPQQPQKQRGKKRQWMSDTFQSFLGSVSGNGGGSGVGDGPVKVSAAVKAVIKEGGDRETAQELERLLGEVSSYEGRLDNLLDLSASIAGTTDGEKSIRLSS